MIEPGRRIGVALRGDLEVVHQQRGGASYAVIKDPHSLQFFEMKWSDYQLATCLRQGATAHEIAEEWQRSMPIFCEKQNAAALAQRAERLCAAVRRLGLADEPGRAIHSPAARLSWGGWLVRGARSISAPLFVRLRLFDPDELLERVLLRWGFLFSAPAMAIAAGFVLLSLFACLGHLDEMKFHPEWFHSWQNLGALYLGILVLKVIHESGHALACKRLGGHVHEVGAQLLAFHPTFFVDVSDTWLWPDRGRRIAVAAAGFGAELIAAAGLFWGWRLLAPGFGRDLCLNLMFIASVSAVLFNANPLMRYDGYHMLADFLHEPRLRQKAFGTVSRVIRRWFFGSRLVPRVREPLRWIFAGYGILSTAYLVWIAFAVAGFLRQLLAPVGLEAVGQFILAAWLFSMALPLLRFLGGLIHDTAHLAFPERWRPLAMGAACVITMAIAAFVPLPIVVERECVTEVSAPGVVRASQPGFIAEMIVREGDRVTQGQVLARLQNRSLTLTHAQAGLEMGLAQVALLSAAGESLPGQVQRGLRRFNEARANETQSALRVHQLELVSPCAGVVLTRHLERKQGQFVRPGDEVVSIAEDSHREVMLPLTEKEARRIKEGARLEFRAKGIPGAIFAGHIGTAPLRIRGTALPRALTALAGGDIAVDPAGNVSSTEVTHVSRGVIEPADLRLRPGLSGRARLRCGSLPAVEWLFEQVLDAIHLRHRV